MPAATLITEQAKENSPRPAPGAPAGSPNILILVLDTLSAQSMSLYGYARSTTPNIDRFAQKATVYHRHYASGNFTSPGTASMLTGAYPWSHRAFGFQGTTSAAYESKNLFRISQQAGFNTTAYTHNWLAVAFLEQFKHDLDNFKRIRDLCLVDEQYSDRLFPGDYNDAFFSERLLIRRSAIGTSSLFVSLLDRLRRNGDANELTSKYRDLFPRGLPNLENVYFVMETAVDWLQKELAQSPRPYLKYIHLLPPHEPYNTRRDFVNAFQDDYKPVRKPQHFFGCCMDQKFMNDKRREYDEYLAYADAEFGRLYDYMAANGILENTYVILTSDHGQMIERQIHGHVTQVLFEPIVRVPLIISRPGQSAREDVQTLTNAVDLVPTLAGVMGQKTPDWAEGRILPGFPGAQPRSDESVFVVEAKSNPKQAALTQATFAIVKENIKLVRYTGYKDFDNQFEMYNLQDDPEELKNIYTSSPLAKDLENELAGKVDEVNRPYTRA